MTMDEITIDHYLEHVPIQMIKLVECLDNPTKWAVFAALLENKKMYFNQIRDEFGANPAEVDRILKSLGAGGLVFKRAKNFADVKNDNRTYYEPSLLGEMFYDSMFNLVIPKKSGTQNLAMSYQNMLSIPSPISGVQFGQQSNPPIRVEKVSGGDLVAQ